MNTLHITDASFNKDVLESQKPVLVDFWAEWCGTVQDGCSDRRGDDREYDGKVVVGKVDVDSNQNIALNYNIRSIPTLMIFKGGEVRGQIIRTFTKNRLSND